jgi:hypothetical protein
MQVTKLVILPAVVAGLIAAVAADDSTAKIKGIYIDGGQASGGAGGGAGGKLGVKFNVKLQRDGKEKLVRSDYDFQDDDHMKFQFQVNRESYVYVLHRTMNGDPSRLKGIDIEAPAPGPEATSYQMLFPNRLTGRNNKMAPNRVYTVPGEADFRMDDKPGVEKLYLVVSPKPLDITKYFNVQDGKIQRGGKRDDSRDDVESQLSKELKGLTGNTDSAMAKGIEIDSYAVARDNGKPVVVQVNLQHYPRR